MPRFAKAGRASDDGMLKGTWSSGEVQEGHILPQGPRFHTSIFQGLKQGPFPALFPEVLFKG